MNIDENENSYESIDVNQNPSAMVAFWEASGRWGNLALLIFGAPLVLVLLIIFGTDAIAHGDAFKQGVVSIVHWIVLYLAAMAVTALATFAFRLVRNVLLTVATLRGQWADARLKKEMAIAARMQSRVMQLEGGVAVFNPIPGTRGKEWQIEVRALSQVQERYNYRMVEGSTASGEEEEGNRDIPTDVRYEDIAGQVPKDHTLVGIAEGGAVETTEKENKGLIWVPGSSGGGKSNTVGLRVDEDALRGHMFLGIDPHRHKPDSLYNLVVDYLGDFIIPGLAQDRQVLMNKVPAGFNSARVLFDVPLAFRDEEILLVLNYYLDEFERRRQGGKCWPLTLLVDEIGNLTAGTDKELSPLQREIKRKLMEVARVAGQESRGFNMNCIMISQDAAGLAWLRKRALLVFAHKMVMMSERMLACNEHKDIAEDMDLWPIGRTAVYGMSLPGIRVRQQPLFERRTSGLYAPRGYQSPAQQYHQIGPLREQKGFPLNGRAEQPGADMIISGAISASYPQPGYIQQPGKPLEMTNGSGEQGLTHAQKEKMLQVMEMDEGHKSQNEIITTVWGCDPTTRQGRAAAEELRLIRSYIAQQARKSIV